MNNIQTNLWTDEEIALFENYTDEQISEMTNRTLCAVRKKRSVIFHPYSVPKKDSYIRKIQKEHRILRLAKELHVKLLG